MTPNPDEHQNLPAVPEAAEVAEARQDTSFEVALEDTPDGTVTPVHDGPGLPMPTTAPTRLPVLPAQLRSPAAARSELARRAGNARHHAAYHGVRSPWYLLVVLRLALAGAVRLAWRACAGGGSPRPTSTARAPTPRRG